MYINISKFKDHEKMKIQINLIITNEHNNKQV